MLNDKTLNNSDSDKVTSLLRLFCKEREAPDVLELFFFHYEGTQIQ